MLDFELSQADSQIRIAGNYQDIKITISDSTKVFYTRQGFGIMKLMEEGQSNIINTEHNKKNYRQQLRICVVGTAITDLSVTQHAYPTS